MVPPVAFLTVLLVRGRAWWSSPLAEDAFYYFGIAQNIVEGDGSTFAGVVPTNGYEPLWLVVLVPIAAVVRHPDWFVVAVVMVQGMFWLGIVHETLKIGRRFGNESAALIGVLALGLPALVVHYMALNGMEASLLLLLLVVAVRVALELPIDSAPRGELWLGVVLALVSLTRLDATVTAFAIAIVTAMRGRPGAAVFVRRMALLLAPAMVALVSFVTFNLLTLGVMAPVSASAKAIGSPRLNLGVAEEALLLRSAGVPTSLGLLALLSAGAAWKWGPWRDDVSRGRLMALIAAFVVAQFAFVAGLSLSTSYGMADWYHYNTALILGLSWMLLAEGILGRVSRLSRIVVPVLAGLFLFAQITGLLVNQRFALSGSRPAADFVRTALPPKATLAMGDRAGAVGYYAERPLLHLEGLTADPEFVRNLAEGTAVDRMIREGVDYYLRYSRFDSHHRIEGDCWRLPEPVARHSPLFWVTVCDDDLIYRSNDRDGTFSIWLFRPQLQASPPPSKASTST